MRVKIIVPLYTTNRHSFNVIALRKKNNSVLPGQFRLERNYHLDIFTSADAIPAGEWHDVSLNSALFLKLEFLKATERSGLEQLNYCYVILKKNNIPVAGYVFQSVFLSADRVSAIIRPAIAENKYASIGCAWASWFSRCQDEAGIRMLISGNNFISGEYGICYRSGFRNTAMNRLSAVIDTITAHQFFPERISLILVKDFYKENKSELPDQLKKAGYHKFSVEPQMILKIHPEWRTFDDYLQAMSKKYRNKTKSVLKKSCLLEEKEITYENYHQFSKSIISLYRNVAQKAGFKLAELNEEYFKVMLETYKDSFKMVAYFLDHKPVAFRSGFSLENHYEAHYIGLDYSINKEQCLYQRILYDFASDAIINQAKELHLGRTAAEMKSNIGAEPHDLIAYMRLRNGLTNKFVSPLIQFLRPTDAVYRSPFRQDS